MNQNKSNVPVSVAEEPDELSYYRLTLLSFLRESHPDLADDESFVATRSEQAAEAFYVWRGIRPDGKPVMDWLQAKQ